MNTILFCPPRSGNFWNMRGRLLLEMIKNNLRVIVLLPRNKDFEKEVLMLKEKNISVYVQHLSKEINLHYFQPLFMQ